VGVVDLDAVGLVPVPDNGESVHSGELADVRTEDNVDRARSFCLFGCRRGLGQLNVGDLEPPEERRVEVGEGIAFETLCIPNRRWE
jgi:hypothetical protein